MCFWIGPTHGLFSSSRVPFNHICRVLFSTNTIVRIRDSYLKYPIHKYRTSVGIVPLIHMECTSTHSLDIWSSLCITRSSFFLFPMHHRLGFVSRIQGVFVVG
eukprot:508708_1